MPQKLLRIRPSMPTEKDIFKFQHYPRTRCRPLHVRWFPAKHTHNPIMSLWRWTPHAPPTCPEYFYENTHMNSFPMRPRCERTRRNTGSWAEDTPHVVGSRQAETDRLLRLRDAQIRPETFSLSLEDSPRLCPDRQLELQGVVDGDQRSRSFSGGLRDQEPVAPERRHSDS